MKMGLSCSISSIIMNHMMSIGKHKQRKREQKKGWNHCKTMEDLKLTMIVDNIIWVLNYGHGSTKN